MGRQTVAYAGLLLDNSEVTNRSRKRVTLIFDTEGTMVNITRRLTWQAPVGGEAMVAFYQRPQGDDWYMKKYIGKVHRGDVITCHRGIQKGSSLA